MRWSRRTCWTGRSAERARTGLLAGGRLRSTVSPTQRVVVDGSNLATEGRSVPSLAQLDEAVRAYAAENPSAEIVVVVDASFGHRVDPAERAQLEAAELHGEVVAPPAGAIGRGDAFILRIAERTGAVVLSNDSFQEFHEEHPWLFEEGRLVGGKPVPGVGWIFTPRRPVRGRRSPKKPGKAAKASPEELAPLDDEPVEDQMTAARKAAEVAKVLQRAERAARRKVAAQEAATTTGGSVPQAPEPEVASDRGAKGSVRRRSADRTASPPATAAAKRTTKRPGSAKDPHGPTDAGLRAAIDQATEEALGSTAQADPAADVPAGSARRRRRKTPPPAVNEPLAFITFVASHPVGSSVEGVVASYTSHGAMVDVAIDGGGVLHCYVPLTGLGTPPPRAAREVLARGQRRSFVLVGLDPPRRMAELALPELAGSGAAAPQGGSAAMVPRR